MPDATTVHVVPTDDLVVHTTETHECICGPEIEWVAADDGDKWLIIHQSLDGRASIGSSNLQELRDYFTGEDVA